MRVHHCPRLLPLPLAEVSYSPVGIVLVPLQHRSLIHPLPAVLLLFLLIGLAYYGYYHHAYPEGSGIAVVRLDLWGRLRRFGPTAQLSANRRPGPANNGRHPLNRVVARPVTSTHDDDLPPYSAPPLPSYEASVSDQGSTPLSPSPSACALSATCGTTHGTSSQPPITTAIAEPPRAFIPLRSPI